MNRIARSVRAEPRGRHVRRELATSWTRLGRVALAVVVVVATAGFLSRTSGPQTGSQASDVSGYAFLAEQQGRPIGFDPCRPVHWVMRAQGAPHDAEPLLQEAFARLSDATGLRFVYDGTTDESYDENRPLAQSERYGAGYAPVLVVWSSAKEIDRLEGSTDGFADPQAADPDGGGFRYLTGSVVLDVPDLQVLPGGRAARLGVVLHELGHLAGLDHVSDPDDIMHPSSGPSTSYTPGALRGLAAVGAGRCSS